MSEVATLVSEQLLRLVCFCLRFSRPDMELPLSAIANRFVLRCQ